MLAERPRQHLNLNISSGNLFYNYSIVPDQIHARDNAFISAYVLSLSSSLWIYFHRWIGKHTCNSSSEWNEFLRKFNNVEPNDDWFLRSKSTLNETTLNGWDKELINDKVGQQIIAQQIMSRSASIYQSIKCHYRSSPPLTARDRQIDGSCFFFHNKHFTLCFAFTRDFSFHNAAF
jgi:hypothetical protein